MNKVTTQHAWRADTPSEHRAPQPQGNAIAAWVASVDQFVETQSRASKLFMAPHPFRHGANVHQARLCKTFRGVVSREEVKAGYCFALTALWLHETAHGRSAQLMQKLEAFCAARSIVRPRAQRRAYLRNAMTQMATLNERQFHGQHALDNTRLQKQKIIIAHTDADTLLDMFIQNCERYRFWEVSNAGHTIGVHFTRSSCVVYDPNDPDGVFEATRAGRTHLVTYLQSILKFPNFVGEQPLSLTAFDMIKPAREVPTFFAGVSQDNVNARKANGKSVAQMTLRFAPGKSALHLLHRFDVSDAAFCLQQALLGCTRDPDYAHVLEYVLSTRAELTGPQKAEALDDLETMTCPEAQETTRQQAIAILKRNGAR